MKAFLFANGDAPNLPALRRMIAPGDLLIAADAGARHILALSMLPTILIGDLDSLEPAQREGLQSAGVPLRQYPPAKDETDLELCLGYALAQNPTEVIITGCYGGRLDQMLGIVALLLDPRLAGTPARLDDGVTELALVRRTLALFGSLGDTVSLLPFGTDATGVSTQGLEYPLAHETLYVHRSRGISNRMVEPDALVEVETGILLCIHQRGSA